MEIVSVLPATQQNHHNINSNNIIDKNIDIDIRKNRRQYEIEFPTGSMGLELEPVIISSERQIGCRVKDYYFDIEYRGLDPQYVQSHVGIGDVISKINGESVISLSFNDVLNKLRSLRNDKRIVCFKNITASISSGKTSSDQLTPQSSKKSSRSSKNKGNKEVSPLPPPHTKSTRKFSFPEESMTQSPVADKMLGLSLVQGQENTVNFTAKSTHKLALKDPRVAPPAAVLSPTRRGLSDSLVNVNSSAGGALFSSPSNNINSGKHAPKSPFPNSSTQRIHNNMTVSPAPTISPRAVKELSNRGASPSVVSMQQRSEGTSPLVSRQFSAKKPSFKIYVDSPTAQRQREEEDRFAHYSQLLQQQQQSPPLNSSPSHQSPEAVSGLRGLQTAEKRTPISTDVVSFEDTPPAPGLKHIMNKVGESIGTSLLHVSTAVSATALDTASNISAVLSQQAASALHTTHEYMPLYSNVDMKSEQAKKNDLLRELSQIHVQLGHVETSQHSRVLELETENDRLSLRIKTLETEVIVVKSERAMDQDAILSLQSEITHLQTENQEYFQQLEEFLVSQKDIREVMAVMERTIEHERVKHSNEVMILNNTVAQYEKTVQQMTAEQTQIRAEMESAFQTAVSKLSTLEQENTVSVRRLQESEKVSDTLQAEVEVLREMQTSNSSVLQLENARLRENMVAQQDWHRERLLEKETEISALKREISEIHAKLTTINQIHAQTEESKVALQSSAASTQSELQLARSNNSKYKEQLQSAQSKIESLKTQHNELLSSLQAEESRYSSAVAAKDTLEEQLKLSELNVTALHTELSSTREEVARLNDLVQQHNIDLLTAQVRLTNAEENLAASKDELSALTAQYSAESEQREETIRELEASLASKDREYNTSLQMKTAQQSEFQTELLSLLETVQNFQAVKTDLEETHENELAQLHATHEALSNVQKQQINELGESVISLKDTVETLIREKEALAADLQIALKDHEAKVAELATDKEAVEVTHSIELEQREEALRRVEAQCAALQESLHRLERERESLVATHNTVIQEQGRALQEAENILGRHQQDKGHLESQIQLLRGENAQLLTINSGTAQEKEERIMSLQQKVTALQRESDESNSAHTRVLEEKTKELNILAQMCRAADDNINKLLVERETYLREASTVLAQKEKEFISTLSLAEDMADNLRSDLHSELLVVQTQANKVQQQLQADKIQLSEKVAELSASLAHLQTERAELASQLSSAEGELSAHLVAEEDAILRIASLEQELGVTLQLLQDTKNKLDLLQSECDEKENLVTSLQQSLASSNDSYSQQNGAIHNELCNMNLLVNQLTAELNGSEQSLKAFRAAIKQLEAQSVSEAKEYQTKVAALLKEKTGLQQQVASQKQRMFSATSHFLFELRALRSQLGEMRGDVAGLNKVHTNMISSLTATARENVSDSASSALAASLQQEVQRTEGRLSKILQEKESLTKRLAASEEQASESDQKCISACKRAIALEKTVAELKAVVTEQLTALTSAEKNVEDATTKAQRDLSAQLEVVRSLKATLSEHNEKESDLNGLVEEHKQAIDILTQKCQGLVLKISNLEAANSFVAQSSSSELAQLQNQLHGLHREKSGLENELSRLETESQLRETGMQQRMSTELAALKKEQEEALESSRAERAALIASYEARLAQLDSHHKEVCDQLRQQHEKQIKMSQQTQRDESNLLNSAAQDAIRSYEATVAKLHLTMAALKDEHSALDTKRDATVLVLNNSVHALRLELGQARTDCMTVERERNSLLAQVGQLETQLSEATQDLLTQKEIASTLQVSVAQFETQMTARTEDLSLLRSADEALRADLASAQTTIASMQQAATQSQIDFTALELIHKNVLAQYETAAAQAEEYRQQFNSSQSDLTVFMEEKRSQVVNLGAELKASKQLQEQLAASVKDLEGKCKQSQQDLSKARHKLNAADEEIATLEERVSEQAALLDEKEQSLSCLHRKLSAVTDNSQSSQQKTLALQNEIAECKQRLRDAEDRVQLSKLDTSTWKTKLQELMSTIITQQQVLSEAEDREKEFKVNRLKLEALVSQSEQRYQDVRGRLSTAESHLAQVYAQHEHEVLKLKDDLLRLQSVAHRTEKELQCKSAELESLHGHVQALLLSTVSPEKLPRPQQMTGDEMSSGGSRGSVVVDENAKPSGKAHQTSVSNRRMQQQHAINRSAKMPLSDITPSPAAMLSEKHAEVDTAAEEEDKENNSRRSIRVASTSSLHHSHNLSAEHDHSNKHGSNTFSGSATSSPPEITVSFCSNAQWLEELISLSLDMHESIVFLFMYLHQNIASSSSENETDHKNVDKKTDKHTDKVFAVLLTLSKKHHAMHEFVVRPPWIVSSDSSASSSGAIVTMPENSAVVHGASALVDSEVEISPPRGIHSLVPAHELVLTLQSRNIGAFRVDHLLTQHTQPPEQQHQRQLFSSPSRNTTRHNASSDTTINEGIAYAVKPLLRHSDLSTHHLHANGVLADSLVGETQQHYGSAGGAVVVTAVEHHQETVHSSYELLRAVKGVSPERKKIATLGSHTNSSGADSHSTSEDRCAEANDLESRSGVRFSGEFDISPLKFGASPAKPPAPLSAGKQLRSNGNSSYSNGSSNSAADDSFDSVVSSTSSQYFNVSSEDSMAMDGSFEQDDDSSLFDILTAPINQQN